METTPKTLWAYVSIMARMVIEAGGREGRYVVTIAREEFTGIGKDVKPDAGRRVVLPKALVGEGVTYRIYADEKGQILLVPQVTIPASEAWLFRNPEALASVKRGLADDAEGRVSKVDLDTL